METKIKKIEIEEIPKNIPSDYTHKIEVNDKIVRIEEVWELSADFNQSYESDFQINTEDITKLTDEEVEFIGENMSEIVELNKNEVF